MAKIQKIKIDTKYKQVLVLIFFGIWAIRRGPKFKTIKKD